MSPELTAAIARLKEKGDALGEALAAEQALEDQRSLIKEMAIRRIMDRDKCSATAAKDIVRSDLEYMNHRIAQKESVIAHYRAEAEYEAAKCEARQASLLTPDIFALDSEITELREANTDLVEANRELAVQNVAYQAVIEHRSGALVSVGGAQS